MLPIRDAGRSPTGFSHLNGPGRSPGAWASTTQNWLPRVIGEDLTLHPPTRSLFGFKARVTGSWCGRRDLNPHGPCGPTDFHALLRLSPPLLFLPQGLGSGLSLHHVPDGSGMLGATRLVSTPSQPDSGRAWLGIAISQGSPTLSSSAPPVSRRALKFSLKSDASADSATPAWHKTR